MSLPFEPPQVIRTSPSNLAMGVGSEEVVELEFSVSIDPKSLDGAIRIEDQFGAAVPFQLTYDPFSRVVILRPQAPWAPGVTYRVLVRGDATPEDQRPAVKSAIGVPMLADFLLTFTTAAVETLPAPLLLSPADASLVSLSEPVRFRWQQVPGAAGYELVVSASPTFEPAAISVTTPDLEYQPAEPLGEGNWWWQVRALDADGRPGVWSSRMQLVVRDLAPASEPQPSEPVYTVLSTFPEDGFSSVGTNLKSIVVHIDRPLPEELVGPELFAGYGEPVDEDPSRDAHGDLVGTVRQEIQPDGTALLIWELAPLG